MREWLDNLDKFIFTLIHAKWAMPSLDWLFLLLRNPLTWIPLYVFIIFRVIRFGKKYAWQFILISIINVSLTDYISSGILKPFFHRLRPCHDAVLEPILRGIISCGGLYSMPSSHAANHFGLATFWFWSIYLITGKKWYWLWIWAFLICYSQVYVGVHYPFDMVAGSFIGITIGTVMAKLFERWLFPQYFFRHKQDQLHVHA